MAGIHQMVFGGGRPKSFADEVMVDTPWAWWKLDEGDDATFTADASGNERHLTGTLNPLVKRKQAPLMSDGGFSQIFDSTAGSVNGGNLTAFAGHVALSLFCVIKVNSLAAGSHLIHNGNTTVSNGQGQILFLETTGALKFTCFASGAWRSVLSDPAALALSETALVGWVHDPIADTLKFCKNGAVIKTVPYTFGLGGGASAAWAIGGLNGNSPGATCTIDHALVFNAALSDARILAHAKAAGFA